MTATVFDTHAAVTTLRGAGFDERQAEGVVSMVRQALSEGVATKADIKDIRGEIKDLRGEIKQLEGRIESIEGKVENIEGRMATKEDLANLEDRMATKEDLARLETRMTVRFFGGLLAVVVASTGLTVALMKLLP